MQKCVIHGLFLFYTKIMEQIINRLIDIGYDLSQAEKIYYFYQANNDLDGLEDYIVAKECMAEIL